MNAAASGRRGASPVTITSRMDSPGRRTSIEERRRLVAESLNVGNPANNGTQLPEVADPRFECQLELAVAEIEPYDRNPRRSSNLKFEEIKQSIRASGIRNPLTVTRRPGARHFIVETGGNTRLVATQQLWAETGDPRFQKITVMYRPWRSESHVLVAHLAENDQRGDLTYWDKATGIMALKTELEGELVRPMTLRQFEEELKRVGLSISRSSLGRFQFATEKLGALGDARAGVTGLDIKYIQPRLNLFKRYAEKRAGLSESDLYARVLNPVFERAAYQYSQSRTFSSTTLCGDCEQALAECFTEPVAEVRTQLNVLEKSSGPSSEEPISEVGVQSATVASHSKSEAAAPDASAESVIAGNGARPPAGESSSSRALSVSAAPPPIAKTNSNEAHARSGIASPESQRESASSGMAARLKPSLISFARLTDVANCLHFTNATVCGYYMEAPEIPVDLEPDKPLRRWAWWLLALLSGQMRADVSRQLPETSRWRHLFLTEAVDEGALPLLLENELAAPLSLDLMFVDWLTDPQDEAATLLCEILNSVRSLRAALPKPISPPHDRELPGRDG